MEEFEARGGCRTGLKGVLMLHEPTGQEFECGASRREPDGGLSVVMGREGWKPGREPEKYREESDEGGVVLICLADITEENWESPPFVSASECLLLSEWRVTCCPPRRGRKVSR
jgi:hypothetical protein